MATTNAFDIRGRREHSGFRYVCPARLRAAIPDRDGYLDNPAGAAKRDDQNMDSFKVSALWSPRCALLQADADYAKED